jgi:hypothetical protein
MSRGVAVANAGVFPWVRHGDGEAFRSGESVVSFMGREMYPTAIAPKGEIALINTRYIAFRHVTWPTYGELESRQGRFLNSLGVEMPRPQPGEIPATRMPMSMVGLAKKEGKLQRVSVRLTCAMGTSRRNAHALITDIDEG